MQQKHYFCFHEISIPCEVMGKRPGYIQLARNFPRWNIPHRKVLSFLKLYTMLTWPQFLADLLTRSDSIRVIGCRWIYLDVKSKEAEMTLLLSFVIIDMQIRREQTF